MLYSKHHPFAALADFLPEGTFDMVVPFFKQYPVRLTITRDRKTLLGNYSSPTRSSPIHKISINVGLNPYSFLVTLLHEMAHLIAFAKHGHQIAPHGEEWKSIFKNLLADYMEKNIFPQDVEKALSHYMKQIKASTCSDPILYKTLKQYDIRKSGHQLIESIQIGSLFQAEDGKVFKLMEKRRTRYKCEEVNTGKLYLFAGIAEVKLLDVNMK